MVIAPSLMVLFIIKIIMLTLGTSGEDYIDMDYSETCIILKFSDVLVLLTNSALIVTYVYTIYDICMQLKGLEWNGKYTVCLFSISLPLFHLHYYKCIQDRVIKERKLCNGFVFVWKEQSRLFAGGIELPLTSFSWEWLVKTE